MSILEHYNQLKSKVAYMFQCKEKYNKTKNKDDLVKWLTAENQVKKIVTPPKEEKENSLFNFLAQ